MVDLVKRRLREGVSHGEHAPVILVRDTVKTTGGPPFLKHLLWSVCDNISRGLSQATSVVVVALSEPPECYTSCPEADLADGGRRSWFRLLDCYTDPLGWEGGESSVIVQDKTGNEIQSRSFVCRDILNLDGLLSLILQARMGPAQSPSKERMTIFFDSVSVLLRYHSLQALMAFLSTLRSHHQVTALSWIIHADLQDPRTARAFEYASSTIVAVEPYLEVLPESAERETERLGGGLVLIKQKRRNGRVREQVEQVFFSADELTFGPVEKLLPFDMGSRKTTVPKVQFNLALTEKELEDRSKVMLPFEHQGNGQEGKIYDGRANMKMSYLRFQARDLALSDSVDGKEGKVLSWRESYEKSHPSPEAREWAPAEDSPGVAGNGTGLGEVHYLRDSDDEHLDSDEDPDEDLDI